MKRYKEKPSIIYKNKVGNNIGLSVNGNIVVDGLYKTRIIAMFVKYCIISAFIKKGDQAPLSLFLIAPTEENKTKILLMFSKFRSTKYKESLTTKTTVDMSTKPLNDFIKEQGLRVRGQNKFHIIIPDFCKTILHSSKVVDAVIGTLLALMEEGVENNMFYGQQYNLPYPVKMGLITAVTPLIFKKYFRKWNAAGLLTRPIFVCYEYTEDTKKEIQQYIQKDLPVIINEAIAKIRKRGKKNILIDNPDIAAAIKLENDKVVERLKTFHVRYHTRSTSYNVYLEIQGFRMHKMLRLLIKSIAYDHGRDAVNYEDLVEFKNLCNLIRLPDNPKRI